MGSPFDEILNHDVLLDLAGERYFERGEGYHRGGHVRALVEHDGVLVAKVLGTYEYRVRFRVEDGGIAYSCDCPLGVNGEFCKHCVAVGLAWLEGEAGHELPEEGAEPVTMDDVRAYLSDQDKDALVRIVMEQAMEDDRLRERLLLRAARKGGGAPNLTAFRRAIDSVVEPPRDYWDYGSPWDYAQGIESIAESVLDLLREGFVAEAIEVSEYALAAVEKAMDYDADGAIYGILQRLEEIHHSACKEAKPDPEALAARLFKWELEGHHDTFYEAVESYADVLGEKGLAEYRRLAEEEWASLPILGPDRKNAQRYYDRRRFRLTNIMRTLASLSGDIEEVVAIESKDLSSPEVYLRIAKIYDEAGDSDRTLEWAEEGMWVFPDEKHFGLRGFLAEQYHERGRHEEAMTLAWAEFIESSDLGGYQRLKTHTDRAGGWGSWREKALAFVREDIARRKEEPGRYYLSFPEDHSRLVRIFLWEEDVEAAWREAKEGGCSDDLWLELAARREQDHPKDALTIYQPRIEPLINQTNNTAYKEAYELLLRMRGLMKRLDREQEFDEYLELIRMEYKRKRNFMKLLDGME